MEGKMANYREGWCRLDLTDTPLGPISLVFSPDGLASLAFEEYRKYIPPDMPTAATDWAVAIQQELIAYFSGRPADFQSFPMHLEGTPFHRRVWEELRRIPLGQTISYRELAARVGKPRAVRAVGQANGANPIPIIIPCHRVIAADGSLGGYSSGLDRKRWLLEHEQAAG
jgi:O-6-methylguanine DNA methyltransferase